MHAIGRLLGAAALIAVADGAAASTTNLRFDGFETGSRNVKVDARIAGADNDIAAAAGTFSVTGDNPVETFVAWCIDIATWLHAKGSSKEYVRQDVLSAGQTTRLQTLFDASYGADVLANKKNSAAFQVAIWDAIYDDDWNAQTKGGDVDNFFRVVAGYSSGDVQTQANLYLTAAMSYGGGKVWSLTQYDGRASNTQSLVTVAAMPLPGGVLLLASGFGAAALVRRRRRGEAVAQG